MTDEPNGDGRAHAQDLVLTTLFRLDGADVVAFERYEAAVIPLIPTHGGRLERRIRANDNAWEIHVLRFPDRGTFERYLKDESRQALAPLLAASGASVEVIEGRYIAHDDGGEGSPAAPDALDPDSTALILVDVQQGFDDPSWGRRNNRGAESRIARLLANWRSLLAPVHHVRHASTELGSTLEPAHPGHAFKPEATPHSGEPIHTKTVNSAFIGTSLEADLRGGGITTVVLVGLTTNHCVSTTARMAANLGFRTIVVADATAAFGCRALDGRFRPAEEVHDGALSDLAGEFAIITDAAAVSAAMDAGTVVRWGRVRGPA